MEAQDDCSRQRGGTNQQGRGERVCRHPKENERKLPQRNGEFPSRPTKRDSRRNSSRDSLSPQPFPRMGLGGLADSCSVGSVRMVKIYKNKNFRIVLDLQKTHAGGTEGSRKAPSSVQSLGHVWLLASPWAAAGQAPLPTTNSWSLLRLTAIEPQPPLFTCHLSAEHSSHVVNER